MKPHAGAVVADGQGNGARAEQPRTAGTHGRETSVIIQRSGVLLAASHTHQVRTHETESMRAWVGGRQPSDGRAPVGDPGRGRDRTDGPVGRLGPIGAAASDRLWAHRGAVGHGSSSTGEDDRTVTDPVLSGRLSQLVALVERLTGQRVQVLDPSDLEVRAGTDAAGNGGAIENPGADGAGRGPVRAGWGLEYTRTETTAEQEATSFRAAGSVSTADGREIDLEAELRLYRSTVSTSTTRLTAGDALIDPLVLSFGTAPALSRATVGLDLDGDGTAEQVPLAGTGSAYLALDRNGNGVVDDGSELFGPATGDGFAELSGYDGDGNGWIDGADPVFSRLRLWEGASQTLAALADRGVGAIGLASVGTPFTLGSGSQGEGRPLGELRATGVWLGEDGSVGTVHEVDLHT